MLDSIFRVAILYYDPIRALSCTRFFFFYLVGLERYSDISLTDHSLLRKPTVNLPLGEGFVLTRGAVQRRWYISSPGNIPPRRYARVTGFETQFGEPKKYECKRVQDFSSLIYTEKAFIIL